MNPLPAFFLIAFLGHPAEKSMTPFDTAQDCMAAMTLVTRVFPGSVRAACFDSDGLMTGSAPNSGEVPPSQFPNKEPL